MKQQVAKQRNFAPLAALQSLKGLIIEDIGNDLWTDKPGSNATISSARFGALFSECTTLCEHACYSFESARSAICSTTWTSMAALLSLRQAWRKASAQPLTTSSRWMSQAGSCFSCTRSMFPHELALQPQPRPLHLLTAHGLKAGFCIGMCLRYVELAGALLLSSQVDVESFRRPTGRTHHRQQ